MRELGDAEEIAQHAFVRMYAKWPKVHRSKGVWERVGTGPSDLPLTEEPLTRVGLAIAEAA